jgi:hypothetical protein
MAGRCRLACGLLIESRAKTRSVEWPSGRRRYLGFLIVWRGSGKNNRAVVAVIRKRFVISVMNRFCPGVLTCGSHLPLIVRGLLAGICFLAADFSGASTTDDFLELEFCGYAYTGAVPSFSILRKVRNGRNVSHWVRCNEPVDGFVIRAFDPIDETVLIEHDGTSTLLNLEPGWVRTQSVKGPIDGMLISVAEQIRLMSTANEIGRYKAIRFIASPSARAWKAGAGGN